MNKKIGHKGQGEPVGVTCVMHGAECYTMAVFDGVTVPAGTKLYTSAPTIPEGYALVPVEPTLKMLNAAWGPASHDWPAMLAAAPKPKDMP